MNADLTNYFQRIHNTLHGWCTESKARVMVDLIIKVRPTVCVEVGVFGGRSLYPTALALKYNGLGSVVGIDPWAVDASIECMASEAELAWWKAVDHDSIYRYCQDHILALGISDYARLLRLRSDQAAGGFPDRSINVLHIDGNHSEKTSVEDVTLWLPKVAKHGFIWFDDIDWASTQPAVKLLESKCDPIESFETFSLYRLRDEEIRDNA